MKFLAELGTRPQTSSQTWSVLSPGRLSGVGDTDRSPSFRFADDITAAVRQRIFLPFAEVPSAFIGNPKSHAGHVVAADQPFLFALGGIAASQTQRENIRRTLPAATRKRIGPFLSILKNVNGI